MSHRIEVEFIVGQAIRKERARSDKELAKRDAKIEALERQAARILERLDQCEDGGYR